MEYHPLPLDEHERFEAGMLSHDTDTPVAVALMQAAIKLLDMNEAGEEVAL